MRQRYEQKLASLSCRFLTDTSLFWCKLVVVVWCLFVVVLFLLLLLLLLLLFVVVVVVVVVYFALISVCMCFFFAFVSGLYPTRVHHQLGALLSASTPTHNGHAMPLRVRSIRLRTVSGQSRRPLPPTYF